jgi:hypothetical protein
VQWGYRRIHRAAGLLLSVFTHLTLMLLHCCLPLLQGHCCWAAAGLLLLLLLLLLLGCCS